MPTKNILFIFSLIFFLIGIFIHNISQELTTSLLVLLFIVVLFLCIYFLNKKYLVLLISCLLAISIGILVSYNNLEKISSKQNILNPYLNSKSYTIRFETKGINKVSDYQAQHVVKVLQIESDIITENILAQIKISKNYKLYKGDIIETKVKLYEFKDFDSFAYKKYMYSKNIFFSSIVNSYELVGNNDINIVEQYIIKFRNKFLESIYEIYPKEEAIFLGGILIGARESLPKELKEDFNNSGLTHFIAVSGFNITILIIFITYLLKYFPNSLKIIIITVIIILFTILVGDTAPVIRASIMGLIGYYVLISGRNGNILSIILLTAVIMILYSPLSLNYDVSLHLSFFAVLGIVYTQKSFEKVFNFLPNILEIKTAFTLTLSALVFTLPIMIINFGQMSILAPFSNIAVTWTIPIAMLLGFISIIVHFVYPLGGILIGYFTWILLKWDILVVHFFGNLEWSVLKIDFGIYKYAIEIAYFIILIFIIIWFRENKKEQD